MTSSVFDRVVGPQHRSTARLCWWLFCIGFCAGLIAGIALAAGVMR